ncbi:hypothetical protein ABZ942_15505 [Nocardia sp. NPDC046473]|uniref:hypothetical protein n=1 Tax=Nocardia sp. NPDC046473 TaxID=3155733 RepID=UPI0033CF090A
MTDDWKANERLKQQALESVQSLTDAQRHYALGCLTALAPEAAIVACQRARERLAERETIARLEAQQ